MATLDPLPGVLASWKIEMHNFPEVNVYLDELIAQGVTFLNLESDYVEPRPVLDALTTEIRIRLSNVDLGVAILDLGTALDLKSQLLPKVRLLIVLIGNQLGRTVTRNHLGTSPFLPVYKRKEGKGDNYIGNALTSNRPGIHTDGSAWRKARVDLLALLSVSSAFFGGETILVNALRVFEALPSDLQAFLTTRSFIRQDPFDHKNLNPVRRTVYHTVKTRFYEGLGIKYHRTRIEGGHAFLREPLSKEDKLALDRLEALMQSTTFRYHFKLRSGQVLLVNNNFICHDRTRFIDLGKRKRYLERYWAGQHY